MTPIKIPADIVCVNQQASSQNLWNTKEPRIVKRVLRRTKIVWRQMIISDGQTHHKRVDEAQVFLRWWVEIDSDREQERQTERACTVTPSGKVHRSSVGRGHALDTAWSNSRKSTHCYLLMSKSQPRITTSPKALKIKQSFKEIQGTFFSSSWIEECSNTDKEVRKETWNGCVSIKSSYMQEWTHIQHVKNSPELNNKNLPFF